jgi:hydrogenase maturation protease
MHDSGPIRCLILTCGNPLRSDDGVGPWLAAWAQEHFDQDPGIRIMYRQQWTPELAHNISRATAVIFIDASTDAPPGAVQLHRVAAAEDPSGLASHHLHAHQLLALASQLYESIPVTSLLLTLGIGSTAFGSSFSGPVRAALGEACALLEKLVNNPHDPLLLSEPQML